MADWVQADPTLRATLQRRALRLEYFTVGYNLLEGIISVGLGIVAGSVALIGFGLDSGVEVLSALVLLWRLTRQAETDEQAERLERRAVLFVGVSFFILAAYVGWQAVDKIISQERPAVSWGGIVLALASVIIMPWLAAQKKKVALIMNSRALLADSTETLYRHSFYILKVT